MKKKPSFNPARAGIFAFIFVAVVMMGSRVQEMAGDIAKGQTPQAVASAKAETAATQTDKPAHAEEVKNEEPKSEKTEEKTDGAATSAETHEAEIPESYSEAEVNILKKLSERRQELEKRARDMDQREALLKVTEQRVDKKLGDLKEVRAALEQAIGGASEEQKARADSLVKIYETMKPKEAARIFDALDMPVLIGVISRMKETKVAPILAAMDAQMAKKITSALIEKKPLPTMPQ